MSGIILAPEAAQDIEEIVSYIANENAIAALEIQERFRESFYALARFPNSGHARKDLAGDRPLLFSSAGKYLIFYHVRGE